MNFGPHNTMSEPDFSFIMRSKFPMVVDSSPSAFMNLRNDLPFHCYKDRDLLHFDMIDVHLLR